MIEDQCIKLQANGVFHWDVADKFGLFPILMLSFLQRIKKYLKVKLLHNDDLFWFNIIKETSYVNHSLVYAF